MFLRKKRVNGSLYWSLVESRRDGKKVRQHVVMSLGNTASAYEKLSSNSDLQRFRDEILPYMSNAVSGPVPRILEYPGSKWSMAEWIISNMPDHSTYLEPFFGSGAVLFNKARSKNETINDIDGNVVNLFRVVRERPSELAKLIAFTPYSRTEYYVSYQDSDDDLERARRFLVRLWQAFGGKTSDRTGWRSAIDARGTHKVKKWSEVPERIMAVSERLKGVQIEQQPALQLIERYKRPDVLIYADPPYILSTRSKRIYKHEMGKEDEHEQLLDALIKHPGPVLISGYEHPLYDEKLRHWRRETKSVQSDGGRARTEILWINRVANQELQSKQMDLFQGDRL